MKPGAGLVGWPNAARVRIPFLQCRSASQTHMAINQRLRRVRKKVNLAAVHVLMDVGKIPAGYGDVLFKHNVAIRQGLVENRPERGGWGVKFASERDRLQTLHPNGLERPVRILTVTR